jgi:hypothetical protein
MVSSVALAMVLAFEPTEPDVMRRAPRPVDEPLLPRFLVWRIVLVSSLFLAGIFGMFEWALRAGMDVDAARTVAVNTLVCMEVFYLFSVRYLKAGSFSWRGVRGTPLVLLAAAGVHVHAVHADGVPHRRAAARGGPRDRRGGRLGAGAARAGEGAAASAESVDSAPRPLQDRRDDPGLVGAAARAAPHVDVQHALEQ